MHDPALDELWALTPGPGPAPVTVLEPTLAVPSAFAVGRAATVAVAAATAAAAELGRERGLPPHGPTTVDGDHAVASCAGFVRLDEAEVPSWAPLSGRYRTADGHVLIHANFPHHAEGVAARLGVPVDREAVAGAIAGWRADELERELVDAGMVCAAYRTLPAWDAHPHARATADLAVVSVERLGDADPAPLGPARDRALDGVRVLDCTRVLAGPVGGQTLAAHGADVLRVGAAHLPSIPMGVLATGSGKRNAHLDLGDGDDRRTFTSLLAGADVFVDAYRPGALAARGFGAEAAAALRPGIVVIEICAFDWVGPWAGRRGFDSIVQAATGIAAAGGERATVDPSVAVEPVHLPFQALDYATGYLAAHAAARLLAARQRQGGSWRARLSLLRTRNWLVGLGRPHPFVAGPLGDVSPWTEEVDAPAGRVRRVSAVAGRWDRPPAPLGSSPPAWLERT
ncbi:MAG: CoA transferase [Acidimicrobiales bacterium]